MELNKMMLKGLMKMISPEQIEDALRGITEKAIEAKRDFPLEKGEDYHTIMIYEIGGELYFTIAIIKDADQMMITRFVQTQKLIELIKSITKNI